MNEKENAFDYLDGRVDYFKNLISSQEVAELLEMKKEPGLFSLRLINKLSDAGKELWCQRYSANVNSNNLQDIARRMALYAITLFYESKEQPHLSNEKENDH
jgi:3-dehydroquinate dehydratase